MSDNKFFIRLCYGVVGGAGYDTSNMGVDEVVEKFEELNKNDKKNNQDNQDNKVNKINKLKEQLNNAQSILEKIGIANEIVALENGFENYDEFAKYKEEERIKYIEESTKRKEEKQKLEEEKNKKEELVDAIKTSPKDKLAQFNIIQKNNPMMDDYHTGIRSPKDIKYFSEVVDDEESFVWGDFDKKDAEEALKKGTITIYSSYPIQQGTFVSTSRIQAQEYAGGGRVYEKTVPLEKVAWINGDEGQFADIDEI